MISINKFLSILLLFCSTTLLFAQEVDSTINTQSNTFVAMPLVSNNPTMKTGFGAMAMYLFPTNKEDNVSPPSTAMFYGLYSTNNSYIFLLPVSLFFANDKYRQQL